MRVYICESTTPAVALIGIAFKLVRGYESTRTRGRTTDSPTQAYSRATGLEGCVRRITHTKDSCRSVLGYPGDRYAWHNKPKTPTHVRLFILFIANYASLHGHANTSTGACCHKL